MPQFIHPLEDHILTRDFYYRADFYVGGQHAACDYIREEGMTRGSRIMAIAGGVGVSASWDTIHGFSAAVDHADGFRSVYRHLIEPASVVSGQPVKQGQIIGHVGNTGMSQGDHLHFDLWNRDKIRDDNAIFYKNGWYAVDPELYLGKEDGMALTVEQFKDIHHFVVKVIPQLLRDNDERAEARYKQLKLDIEALGAGAGGAHRH